MATVPEIALAMERLADAMPAPRGVDPAKAFDGYVAAIRPFRMDDINEAIDRYLSGAFPKISAKFYPRAPELASCVRAVVAERSAELDRVRRLQSFKADQEEAVRLEEVFRNRTPEQRAVVTAAHNRFVEGLSQANGVKAEARRERDRQRAEIRARYGMTDEALAVVPDRKLPNGMAPVADAKSSDQPFRRENRQGLSQPLTPAPMPEHREREADELGALFEANR